MRQLNYDLKMLVKDNRTGSYNTQADRHKTLQMAANQLHELGYHKMKAKSLKPKHIDVLVNRWKQEGIATGTLKNRMSTLRWWAKSVGKPAVIHKNNAEYEIDKRIYVTNVSKAKELELDKLEKVTDSNIKLSLELQKSFGLRREESIKFRVGFADQGDHIRLKSTWTKGGKARTIPISNNEQRELLERVKRHTGQNSLIPSNKTYIQQLKTYENQCNQSGLNKMHGLRHAYAQRRYTELTGWRSPAQGGPKSKELLSIQKTIDKESRLLISKELGHEREAITAVYLGR